MIDSICQQVLKQRLVTKPFPKSRDLVQAPDWRRVTVRLATEADAPMIASWASTSDEVRFLGVEACQLGQEEVITWIRESAGAFLLTRTGPDEADGAKEEPVAFANLAPVEQGECERLEVGRLIVPQDERRKGFGSTLVRHICSVVGAIRDTTTDLAGGMTLSRVVRENWIGLRLVAGLPFEEMNSPFAGGDAVNRWYKYRERRPNHLLGDCIQEFRRERGLNQADLAFHCGVQRGTINMIENGNRTPSLDLLYSMVSALCSDEVSTARLLLAAIGATGDTLRAYNPLSDLPETASKNLWIVSDELAELLRDDDRYFLSSVQALIDGLDRVYFIPRGQWETKGKLLTDLFAAYLTDRFSKDESTRILNNHFGVYEAPEALCWLRIELRNPREEGLDEVRVVGEDNRRVPIPADLGTKLYQSLRTVKSALDRYAERGDAKEVWGFTRHFPEVVRNG